jgi:hypothetical protein
MRIYSVHNWIEEIRKQVKDELRPGTGRPSGPHQLRLASATHQVSACP